jgi:choline-sulfatase
VGAETRILYTSDHGDNVGARGLWGNPTLYEEAAAVPLIVAGEGIPAGAVCRTVAGHVDCQPFILEAVGMSPAADDMAPLCCSIADVAAGEAPERTALSENHGMGSTTGALMIQLGRFKCGHYVKYPPKLSVLLARNGGREAATARGDLGYSPPPGVGVEFS